jgi:hypothetical protein
MQRNTAQAISTQHRQSAQARVDRAYDLEMQLHKAYTDYMEMNIPLSCKIAELHSIIRQHELTLQHIQYSNYYTIRYTAFILYVRARHDAMSWCASMHIEYHAIVELQQRADMHNVSIDTRKAWKEIARLERQARKAQRVADNAYDVYVSVC